MNSVDCLFCLKIDVTVGKQSKKKEKYGGCKNASEKCVLPPIGRRYLSHNFGGWLFDNFLKVGCSCCIHVKLLLNAFTCSYVCMHRIINMQTRDACTCGHQSSKGHFVYEVSFFVPPLGRWNFSFCLFIFSLAVALTVANQS